MPLLATIDPKISADMATSLLNDAAQMGALPKWPVANGESGVMNGDAADPILADTYAFGARGFDTGAALADMVAGANGTSKVGQGWYVERPNAAAYIAKGYVPNVASDSISPVPNGASETLEYALDDFAISRLAGNLHQSGTASTFSKRSQNWANLFDTADGGYIEPRDAAGAFPSGPPVPANLSGFGQSGFQEGNAAQYTWMVPQNLAGLIGGIGGDQATNSRLDTYFSQLNAGPNLPYHWQGNEPALDTPWVYDSTGEPWRTQQVVGQIMSQLYSLTPGGEPGNDDLGAMSSWYVWASLGLYPQTPGVPLLVLGTPQFPQAVIHGAYGTLTVTTHGSGGYVRSLAVDGRTSQHTYVDASKVHRLDFGLTGSPDQTWGTAAGDAPPSYGAGPVTFPASTAASLSVSPGQVRLAPGSSAPVSVTADNTNGSSAAAVTWTATAPAGLTVTPASGTISAPAGGTASASVTVAAAASLATGYYQVTLAAYAANGAVIPPVTLLVTVAAAGQSIPTAYVSNYSDNTVTPVDTRTDTAGPPIAVGSGPDGMTVAGGDLFVANNNSNDVTVIDTTTNAVVKTIGVGSVAADVAATPDGKTVWVTNFGDGTVQPIDVATLTTGTAVAVGSQPERLAVSPDGSQLWVANQGSGTVSDVSLATGTVAHTITVGAAPFGVAVTPDSAHVYVTNGGSSSVSVIDAASASVTGTVTTGADPQYVQISPDGSVAYVADFGAGGVTPIALPGNTAGTFIPTGSGAYAVGFAPGGATAWVVNTNANTVTPVTVATGTPAYVGDRGQRAGRGGRHRVGPRRPASDAGRAVADAQVAGGQGRAQAPDGVGPGGREGDRDRDQERGDGGVPGRVVRVPGRGGCVRPQQVILGQFPAQPDQAGQRDRLDRGVDREADAEAVGRGGQGPGRERGQHHHQQPDHVDPDDLVVDPVHVPEDGPVRAPVTADDREADEEREIAVPVLAEELQHGAVAAVPVRDRQVEGQQRDGDGHHRVGEHHDPVGRAGLDLGRVTGPVVVDAIGGFRSGHG